MASKKDKKVENEKVENEKTVNEETMKKDGETVKIELTSNIKYDGKPRKIGEELEVSEKDAKIFTENKVGKIIK